MANRKTGWDALKESYANSSDAKSREAYSREPDNAAPSSGWEALKRSYANSKPGPGYKAPTTSRSNTTTANRSNTTTTSNRNANTSNGGIMDRALNMLRDRVSNSKAVSSMGEWASRVGDRISYLNTPEGKAEKEARQKAKEDAEAKMNRWELDYANDLDIASSKYQGPTRTEKFTTTLNLNDTDDAQEYEFEREVPNELYNPLSREERDALLDEYSNAIKTNDYFGMKQAVLKATEYGGIKHLLAEQNADAANDRDYGRILRGNDISDMSRGDRFVGSWGNFAAGTGEQIATSGLGLYASNMNTAALNAANDDSPASYRNALNKLSESWYYGLVNGGYGEYDPEMEENVRKAAAYVGGEAYADTVVQKIRERANEDIRSGGEMGFSLDVLDDATNDKTALWKNLQGTIEESGVYDAMSNLQESSQKHIQRAKDINNLQDLVGGNVMDTVIEGGVSTAQNMFDAGLTAMLGLSGAGAIAMIPFALRAYGGSYAEQINQARELGQMISQDIARNATRTATASAAIEVGTEMMWGMVGAMSKVTGGGALDDAAQKKLAEAIAGLKMSESGIKILQHIGEKALGGFTEGLEEVIGDAATRLLTNMGVMTGELTDYSEWVKEVGHSFVVGALGGLMGEVSNIVATPMQQSQIGKQLKSGVLDITADELVSLAQSEAMSGTSLGQEYLKTAKNNLPLVGEVNTESLSNRDLGKLYEAYQETLDKKTDAMTTVNELVDKVRAGEDLRRSDVNRITQNPDAVSYLVEQTGMSRENSEAFSGDSTERKAAVNMALRALASDSTALSEAQAENVASETENANAAVSAPNPFLVMSQSAIDNALQQVQPMSTTESLRAEADVNASNQLLQNMARSIYSVSDAAERLGASEKNADLMARLYSPAQGDSVTFTGQAMKYINQGRNNEDLDLTENESDILTPIQKQAFWNEGRMDYLEEVSRNGEAGQEILLRGSVNGNAGENSVGSAAAVVENAGGNQAGQTGYQQGRGTASQVYRGNEVGREISASELNAKSMAAAGYNIVTDSNDKVANEVKAIAKKYGAKEVIMWRGAMANVDGNAERGFCIRHDDGSFTIGVQLDNSKWTGRQIAIHESVHGLIHNKSVVLGRDVLGNLTESGEHSFATIRDAMIKTLGPDRFNEEVRNYAKTYAGAGIISNGFSPAEMQMVFEEMVCDYVAGMNAFVEVGHFEQAAKARPVAEAAKTAVDQLAENGTRGSPSAAELNRGETARSMEEIVDSPVKTSISIADAIANRAIVQAKDNKEAVQKAHDDIRNILIPIVKPLMGKMDKNGMPLVPEESSFSPNIFSNGSYGFDAEPTTECYRQMGYRALAKLVTDKLGRPLTNIEAIIVNQAAVEIAIDPPCLYCYSLLDRKAKEAYKIQYLNERDSFEQMFERDYGKDRKALLKDIDKQLNPDVNSGSYYSIYLNNGKGTRTDNKDKKARVRLWMEMWANNIKGVSMLDVRNMEAEEKTASHLNTIENKTIRDYKKKSLQDVQKWVQAASQAKKYIPYSAYTNSGKGNLLDWKQSRIDLLNSEYGLRWYSHADFHPAFAIDNMQQVIDASIKGLKGLMYCKPIAAAKIMAPTGMNINVSCFAQFKDGKYISDDKLGANWDEVKALRDQYNNVGSVMVVTSDDMLLWALSQDWVDVVIPLHRVRSGSEFIQEFGLSDYTGQQADKADKAKFDEFMAAYAQEHQLTDKQAASAGKKMKSVYPAEHQNNYDTYLNICKERGLTPRFEKIRNEILTGNYSYDGVQLTPDMYMKLVNETRQSESQTQPLQPKFDMKAAEDAVRSLETQGYFEYFKDSSEWNGKRMTLNDWADQAVKDIEAGKKPSELGYGRDLAVNEKGHYIVSSRQAKAEGLSGIHKASMVLTKDYDYSKSFSEQLDDWASGAFPEKDSLIIGATPEILRKIGLNALPVTINQQHVDYAINGTKDDDHYLGRSGLEQIPDAMERPVAIIASRSPKAQNTSVVMLLPITHKGKTVITPVYIDAFGRSHGIVIDANAATSVHARNNAVSLLTQALQDEAKGSVSVFYINKNETAALLAGARVTMPKSLQHNNGFIHKITDPGSPVKQRISSQTESQQFKRWFNGSKAVNNEGEPKILYHWTNNDFTVFDTARSGKNQGKTHGDGIYLSTSPNEFKYAGSKRMDLYAVIRRPFEMQLTKKQAEKVYEDYFAPFHVDRFNTYRPHVLEKLQSPTRVFDYLLEAAEKNNTTTSKILQDLGFDGVHDGSEWVAFEPTQVKSATDNIGLFDSKNPDIRYSRDLSSAYMAAAERGDTETAQRLVDEAAEEAMPDSEIRNKNGKLLKVYHGTDADFNVFDTTVSGGKNGRAEGFGIYLSPDQEVTKSYGDRQIGMFANITKPAYSNRKTISITKLKALLKSTCEAEAKEMAEDYGGSVKDALKDTWISNYVDTYSNSMEIAYTKAAQDILRMNGSDMEVIQEVMAGMAIREYADAIAFYNDHLTPVTGFDGFWTEWTNRETGKKTPVILAFNSNQLKVADAITRNDDGNIIPLSERFNPKNDDIRFSRDLTNTELYEANRQLQKDLTELRSKLKTRTEQYKYWKGQTKVTEGRQLRIDDVTKLAREIIKGQESSADAKAVAEKMKALGEYLLNGQDENIYDEARLKAYEIAHDILNDAKILNERGGEHFYKDFRDALKQAPIYVAPSVREEVAPDGWNDFRKSLAGTVTLTADNTKGKTVDVIYHDLQSTFGEWLLPEYITSEADQLNKILEVVETYRPIYENLNSYEMADAVEWTANEILTRIIGEEIRETNPTYADRMEKKLADQKAKAQTALKQVRQQRDLKVADLKQHYQQVAEDRRNRKIDSEMRSRLLKIAKRLNNKKLTRATRALLDQYIGELDLVSKGILGRTVKELEALSAWYDSWKESMGDDFIPDKYIERKIARLSKKHISDLTQEEVADLTTVLLNIETMIRTQNELIESKVKMDAYAAGVQTIDDINNSNGKTDFLTKYIGMETATPERMIHRITGYRKNSPLYQAAKELSDGQRKMLDYQMRAEARFKRWTEDRAFTRRIAGKHAQEIVVQGRVNGEMQNVVITPAMRMALYLHEKNDDNMIHIAKGGVLVPDMQLYKKGKMQEAYDKATRVVFTRGMIKEIASHMSAEEKAFADAVDAYYNGMSRNEINETSELLRGYAIAGVNHYYPIDTAGTFLKKEFDAIKRDGSIEGMGMLKERIEGASNPIMLYDMNDTLNKSISQHSKYVGLAIPVRNFNKLYSVTTFGYETSVAEALKKNWGSAAASYIEKMMADVQNGTGMKSDAWGDLLAKARSKYAGAVLNTNASVAIKQAASYPTAAAVVGYGPLMRALADVSKIDLDKLAEYTPLLWYRMKGYSTTELGDIGKEGRHIPKALNWIQAMDVATTTKLVKAAMIYVNENNNLTRGTDAWWKAVAEVYNRIIEETQPNYTMMQRPQILRSDNALTRALNMFKTQPFQNFNILYDAVGNLSAKTRAYKADASQENLTALKEARVNAARAISSQVVSAFEFALMQFLWDAFRGKAKKYKDDDDEMTLASWLKGMGINVLSSAGGMIPFGSYALELGETMVDAIVKAFGGKAVFGQTFYGLSENAAESVNDMGKALINMVTKTAQAIEGGEVTESTIRSIVDSAADIAQFAGIPVNNVLNLFKAIARNAFLKVDGKYVGGYEALRVTTDPAKYKSDYYDLLKKAWLNDPEAFEEIRKRMINATGDPFATAKTSAEDNIAEKVKEWTKEKVQTESFYQDTRDNLQASGLWDKATPEQQEKVMNSLLSLAVGDEKLTAAVEGGKEVGIDTTEYLLYTIALSMADKDGGSHTNADYETAIRMLTGLSDAERSYLWSLHTSSDKNNPWK